MLFAVAFLLILTSCKENPDGSENEVNPIPSLVGMFPTFKTQYLPDFTLTLSGSDFVKSSRVLIADHYVQTEYISDTELRCTVSSDDLLQAGNANDQGYTLDVSVNNPGGGDSVKLEFQVLYQHEFYPYTELDTSLEVVYPFLSYRGETVFAGWTTNRDAQNELYLAKSVDSGVSWGSPQIFHQGSDRFVKPKIVQLSADDIFLVWCYDREDKSYILFASSSDGGASSDGAHILNSLIEMPAGYSSLRTPELLAASTSELFLIFMSYGEAGGSAVFVSRSSNGGLSWSKAEKVGGDGCSMPENPAACLGDDGTIYVACYYGNCNEYGAPQDEEVLFCKSSDGGENWAEWSPINGSITKVGLPDIAVTPNGVVGVVFGSWDSFFVRSVDGGATWNGMACLPGNIPHYGSYSPLIQSDARGNFNVMFNNTCENGMVFQRSVDSGASWQDDYRISLGYRCIDEYRMAANQWGELFVLQNGNKGLVVTGTADRRDS